MTRFRRLVLLPLVLSLAPLPGCTPGDDEDDTTRSEQVTKELVGDFCATLLLCPCIDHTFPDEATCIATMEVSTNGLLEEGHQAGLTFDETCFREEFASIDDQCRVEVPGTEVNEPGSCFECSPFHGSVPVGEACTDYGSFDDCQQGSFCDNGTCVDPCLPGARDEPCSYRTGECEDGLVCDSAANRCVDGIEQGEPCHSGGICAEGLLCSQDTGACVVRPTVGMPCPDLHCADGICVDGTCAPYGEVGATCFVSPDCETGLFCDVPPTSANGGVCAEPRAGGEVCEFPEACASGECRADGT